MRIKTHFSELKGGRKNQSIPGKREAPYSEPTLWQKDYNEHGRDSFKVFAIESNVTFEKQAERETFYMNTYDTLNPLHGYNKKPNHREVIEIIQGAPLLPVQHSAALDELIKEKTINQTRAKHGLLPIDGGDDFLVKKD